MEKKQPAITKTLPQHGTYNVRLKTKDGGTMEYFAHRSLPYDELIVQLEERIADVKRLQALDA